MPSAGLTLLALLAFSAGVWGQQLNSATNLDQLDLPETSCRTNANCGSLGRCIKEREEFSSTGKDRELARLLQSRFDPQIHRPYCWCDRMSNGRMPQGPRCEEGVQIKVRTCNKDDHCGGEDGGFCLFREDGFGYCVCRKNRRGDRCQDTVKASNNNVLARQMMGNQFIQPFGNFYPGGNFGYPNLYRFGNGFFNRGYQPNFAFNVGNQPYYTSGLYSRGGPYNGALGFQAGYYNRANSNFNFGFQPGFNNGYYNRGYQPGFNNGYNRGFAFPYANGNRNYLGFQAPFGFGNNNFGFGNNNFGFQANTFNQPYYRTNAVYPNSGFAFNRGFQAPFVNNVGAQFPPRTTFYRNYQLPAYQLQAFRPATYYQPYPASYTTTGGNIPWALYALQYNTQQPSLFNGNTAGFNVGATGFPGFGFGNTGFAPGFSPNFGRNFPTTFPGFGATNPGFNGYYGRGFPTTFPGNPVGAATAPVNNRFPNTGFQPGYYGQTTGFQMGPYRPTGNFGFLGPVGGGFPGSFGGAFPGGAFRPFGTPYYTGALGFTNPGFAAGGNAPWRYYGGGSGGFGFNPGFTGGTGFNPGFTGGTGFNPGFTGGTGFNPGFTGGSGFPVGFSPAAGAVNYRPQGAVTGGTNYPYAFPNIGFNQAPGVNTGTGVGGPVTGGMFPGGASGYPWGAGAGFPGVGFAAGGGFNGGVLTFNRLTGRYEPGGAARFGVGFGGPFGGAIGASPVPGAAGAAGVPDVAILQANEGKARGWEPAGMPSNCAVAQSAGWCRNGGRCNNNHRNGVVMGVTCSCPPGYMGTQCETEDGLVGVRNNLQFRFDCRCDFPLNAPNGQVVSARTGQQTGCFNPCSKSPADRIAQLAGGIVPGMNNNESPDLFPAGPQAPGMYVQCGDRDSHIPTCIPRTCPAGTVFSFGLQGCGHINSGANTAAGALGPNAAVGNAFPGSPFGGSPFGATPFGAGTPFGASPMFNRGASVGASPIPFKKK